jgi:hypothetical protein
MTALRNPQFVVVEQRIAAGSDWNGVAPTTKPNYSTKGVKVFPEDIVGGLFAFDYTSFFLTEVQQINVDFAGAGTKSIVIRRASGPDVSIFESTDPLESNILITDKFQLATDESIAIISTGAAAAMYARIIARPLHPEPSTGLSFP